MYFRKNVFVYRYVFIIYFTKKDVSDMVDNFVLNINGKIYETSCNKSLLRFLRDDLSLKSVKDGCSQGACGTCTVIIDGKASKSCVTTTAKVSGKTIITTEGLTEEEKNIYTYAFGVKGAVQCGFCTPGMVMSAKALLDENKCPTEDEIKLALKGNICRCTGYKKIVDAVAFAGKIMSGEEEIDYKRLSNESDIGIGNSICKLDLKSKVIGTGVYCDDIEMDGMLYASAVRTKYPRARILDIDISEALKVSGVVAVYTADDVPVNKVGHIQQDWDVLIEKGDITRSKGDALCIVVAENKEALELGKKSVKIEYEALKPVRNIKEALESTAPKIHENGNICQTRHVVRGNAKEAIKNSKYTVTKSIETPFTEHAFLEPESAVAFPYKDGIKILSGDQSVYDTRKEVSIMFGWEPERVYVENMLVGGGFGGKEDVSVQHLAALCAYKTERPVKMTLSRDDSMALHPKRHAMKGTFTLGCDENGIFTGLDCDIYFDTGAYASLCGPVLERACTHATGPYCYQNTDIRGYGVYTNNTPAGAFRGFGVCQSEFALESIINLLAEKVGISPWEIRYRNAIEPGKILPNGQIADKTTALKETLMAVKEVYEKNINMAGIACAMKNTGVGVGLPDKGRAKLVINNGIVELYCAASDMGQGTSTALIQILSEATGLPVSKLKNMGCDSEKAPDSGTSSGSRQTLVSGEAVREAGLMLKKDMDSVCGDLELLNGKDYFYEYYEPTDKLGAEKPNPKSHIAYSYATHVVILDDDGKVKKVVAAHDSGKVVNPVAYEGQIEGGVIMGLGYALTEDWTLTDCVPDKKYGTLGLIRSVDAPDIEAIYVEKDDLSKTAYGAKGVGEIATIPTAPAVQGAYYAKDKIFRNKLPLENTYYSKKFKANIKKTYCQLDK